MKRCFFIGHRDAPQALLPQIKASIERYITAQEVAEFYVGNHGAFDRLVIQALMDAKIAYPWIKLYMVISYHPSSRTIYVPSSFDGTYYPNNMECVPPRYAIIRANRAVIAQVDYVLAYCRRQSGNTHAFVEYARRQKVDVTLLNFPTKED